MTEIAWQQPSAADLAMGPSDGMGTELYTRRGSEVKAPEPNPNFSFPRVPPPPAEEASAEPSTRSRRIRPQNLAILPGPVPMLPEGSPVKLEAAVNGSPGKSMPMSSRGIGHKREGSQFIGGDATKTGPGLMSSSPTKGVAVLPSPPVSAGRRRGHAHRRSGAMSTNDFSAFLNPNASSVPPIPGSAPATPQAFAHTIPPIAHLERAQSQPSMTTREKIEVANAAGEKEDRELASTPRSANSRPRVGFSERIEFIPRPLSTISAETVSSVSTVRPSHSVNGSINSILDQRPPTPVSAAQPSDCDSRPTTSDSQEQQPFFGLPEDDVRSSPQRPPSASGKALFAKRRGSPPPKFSLHDISPGSIDQENYFSRPTSSQISPRTLVHPSTAGSTGSVSPEPGERKRESRGRSIAARLLGKSKHKSRDLDEEASPSIVPSDANVPAGLVSLDDVDFDEDTSCVIHSDGYSEPTPTYHRLSPSPHTDAFDKDDKAVLDLDLTYDSVKIDKDSPASFANVMRENGNVPQHRRTESAPSLSPPQRQSFAPGKGVSPQKMADVFEEDEEPDSPPRAARPKAQSFSQPKRNADLQGLGVQIVDAQVGESAQSRRKSRSPSSKAETAPSESAPSVSDAMSSATDQEGLPDFAVEIANISEEPRFSMVTKSSDEDTITPTSLETPPVSKNRRTPPLGVQTRPANPLDFAPPPSLAPHTPHDSSDLSISSVTPSPNPTNLSFDAPRLNTAASSITDRTTWSSNHPQSSSTCPDSAQSMEDVPSLTSSASGMSGQPSHASHHSTANISPVKRAGQGYHAHTFSGMPSPAFLKRPQSNDADRAFNFGGGLSPRQSRPRNPFGSRPHTANGAKRASLASLTRLMSKGGDSERSKLSISWGAQDVQPDEAKKEKESKGKRLSRVLRFWKSKEKLRDAAA